MAVPGEKAQRITIQLGEAKPMTDQNAAWSPRSRARVAGLLYLATIAAGSFDQIAVTRRVVVAGDAAATASRLLAAEPLWRLAFTLDLIPVYLGVTVLLYGLLKPVSRTLSLLAAFA